MAVLQEQDAKEVPITEWAAKTLKLHRKRASMACEARRIAEGTARHHVTSRAWLQVYCVSWNSEGKRLASGSVDQTIGIIRVDEQAGSVRLCCPAVAAAAHRRRPWLRCQPSSYEHCESYMHPCHYWHGLALLYDG